MKLLFLFTIFALPFCKSGYSQSPDSIYVQIKAGNMKLEEFMKIEKLDLNVRSLLINGTPPILYAQALQKTHQTVYAAAYPE